MYVGIIWEFLFQQGPLECAMEGLHANMFIYYFKQSKRGSVRSGIIDHEATPQARTPAGPHP